MTTCFGACAGLIRDFTMPKSLYEEYLAILAEDGRRVANRWAYAMMRKVGRENFSLDDFYACYALEGNLSEHERCRTGMIDQFDPIGFHTLYCQPLPRI